MAEVARRIDLEADPGLVGWLRTAGLSLVFTSYRSGEVFAVGTDAGGLRVSNCGVARAMGLGASPRRLWVAGQNQLYRFENFLAPGQTHEGHDALFVPLATHTTGALDIHDIAEDAAGVPLFAATHINCLARLAPGYSYAETWRPPFIPRAEAGDRCHLNGIAMASGAPRFVTCLAASGEAEGWRAGRQRGGVVLEVPSGRVVARGLSMPHSPRLHGGRLWLLQSGTGELGWLDPAGGAFTAVARLPGFARGLALAGPVAVVGLSLPRGDDFADLPIAARLAAEGRAPECALHVVDLATGRTLHRLSVGPDVDELYDVAVLPGIRNPRLMRPTDEDLSYFLRPAPLA